MHCPALRTWTVSLTTLDDDGVNGEEAGDCAAPVWTELEGPRHVDEDAKGSTGVADIAVWPPVPMAVEFGRGGGMPEEWMNLC